MAAGCQKCEGTADRRPHPYPQDFTALRIAKLITASETPSAALTVTTEAPWPACFTPSRIAAERARCRSYSLRLGLSRFPLRLLFLFVGVLLLALFLVLLTAFVAHFIILCYCELSFRKIRSTRIMSPTGSVLSNRIQRLSWTSYERLLSLDSAGASEDSAGASEPLRRIASAAGVCPFLNNRHVNRARSECQELSDSETLPFEERILARTSPYISVHTSTIFRRIRSPASPQCVILSPLRQLRRRRRLCPERTPRRLILSTIRTTDFRSVGFREIAWKKTCP